jgi:DNA polymerase-4
MWRRKSISVENTYPQDLPDLAACLAKIPELIESLKKRMNRLDDDYRIHNSFVKMKFRDFNQTTVERQNSNPVEPDLAVLCEEAWQRGNIPVRLLGIGVRLDDLTESGGQLDLFEQTGYP